MNQDVLQVVFEMVCFQEWDFSLEWWNLVQSVEISLDQSYLDLGFQKVSFQIGFIVVGFLEDLVVAQINFVQIYFFGDEVQIKFDYVVQRGHEMMLEAYYQFH